MATKENARILVIGAGVNGSILALGLFKAGIDVTLLARGKRYEDLRDQGLVLEDVFKKTHTVTRVPVTNELRPEDTYDYLLVVVRKNQTSDLLPTLAQNRSPNIVFMINNPSGPEEWIRALGKERVMEGFVFGAGRREGSVIRGITDWATTSSWAGRLGGVPFGEVDGSITPRLTRLVRLLRQAGFSAKVSKQMSDYLATHAALVAALAAFIMQRGYDRESLTRYTRPDYYLLIDSMRQVLDVLRADGIRVVPSDTSVIKVIPRWVLAPILRAALPSRFMEVGGWYHLSQAPDEMVQLAKELKVLVERSRLPVPALRKALDMSPGP